MPFKAGTLFIITSLYAWNSSKEETFCSEKQATLLKKLLEALRKNM
jgi:hypothetical protein